MPSIYEELVTAAETSPEPLKPQAEGESDSAHLAALIKSVSNINDDNWNKLSVEAQKWFNDAAKVVNSNKQLDSCPGYKDTPADAPAKIARRQVKAKAEKAPKEPKAPKEKAVRQARGGGVTDAQRKVIVEHPEWTPKEIAAFMQKNGWPNANAGSIAVDLSCARRMIALATELGFWNVDAFKKYQEDHPTPKPTVDQPVAVAS